MTEEWRPVLGWEGYYEVSSFGNVRSIDRVITRSDGRRRHLSGQALAPADNRRGYLYVNLARGRERKVRVVHQLVAEAFLGFRRCGFESVVCHIDGDRHNNVVSNLRVGTQGENLLDRRRHGTDPNASREYCKRGHLLADPNLVPSGKARNPTWRTCLACSRATNYVKYPPNAHLDVQTLSDEYYVKIMENAA